MFTGIVLGCATVESFEQAQDGDFKIMWVSTPFADASWKIGDSIAHNGVCLTIVEKSTNQKNEPLLRYDIGPETLKASNYNDLKAGQRLNVESSLKAGDPLGGHWVSGHVDGTARLHERIELEEVLTLNFVVSAESQDKTAPFMVTKGSLAIDGVSLTLNSVAEKDGETHFSVTLIPHTLEKTNFADLKVGDRVNIEADIMAKQAARYAEYWRKKNDAK